MIKGIKIMLGIAIALIPCMTFIFAYANHNSANRVESIELEEMLLEVPTAQEMEKLRTNKYAEFFGASTIWLKSNAIVEVGDQIHVENKGAVLVSKEDLTREVEKNTNGSIESMLQAFSEYYQENKFEESAMNGGDEQPKIQIFQDENGVWSMIYDIKCGALYEYSTKLIKYIDGQLQEIDLGYSDVANVGKEFRELETESMDHGQLFMNLFSINEEVPNVQVYGRGTEQQGEDGNFLRVFDVATDVSLEDMYNVNVQYYLPEEVFMSMLYEEAAGEGVYLNDVSENQRHWTDNVEESYYYWVLESIE